jgi:predicted CoA-binding protein
MLYPLSYRGVACIVADNSAQFEARVNLRATGYQSTLNRTNPMLAGPLDMKAIFAATRTIAIVGLSDNPDRASHEVALYLRPHYKIIPVNPNHQMILGLPCYPDLAAIPEPVDMVDVFQRSENVMPLVQPAIDIGVRIFWMQLGITQRDARRQLTLAGISVVEDKCTKIEHARLLQASVSMSQQ